MEKIKTTKDLPDPNLGELGKIDPDHIRYKRFDEVFRACLNANKLADQMMNQTRGLAAVEGPEFDHSLILQGYEVVKPIDRPKPSVAQIERRDCV